MNDIKIRFYKVETEKNHYQSQSLKIEEFHYRQTWEQKTISIFVHKVPHSLLDTQKSPSPIICFCFCLFYPLSVSFMKLYRKNPEKLQYPLCFVPEGPFNWVLRKPRNGSVTSQKFPLCFTEYPTMLKDKTWSGFVTSLLFHPPAFSNFLLNAWYIAS
jgi:hypothetical protein